MKRKYFYLLVIFILLLFFWQKEEKPIRENGNQVSLKDSVNLTIKKTEEISPAKENVTDTLLSPKEEKTKKNTKTNTDIKPKEKEKSVKQKEKLNQGKIIFKDGLDKKILIYQNFKYPSKNGEYISEIYDTNIKNPGFVSLSAYTLDMNDKIRLFYKYFDGEKWTDWIELPKDTHFVNHKRNVFGLATINSDINKIQFKTNLPPQSEVVFNFFIPKQS